MKPGNPQRKPLTQNLDKANTEARNAIKFRKRKCGTSSENSSEMRFVTSLTLERKTEGSCCIFFISVCVLYVCLKGVYQCNAYKLRLQITPFPLVAPRSGSGVKPRLCTIIRSLIRNHPTTGEGADKGTFLGVNSGFRSTIAGLKYTMIHYNWP